MEKSVVIKSTDTDAVLKFSNPKNDYFEVSFSSSYLSASKRVWGYKGAPCEFLVGLLNNLASQWRGWDGIEEWSSMVNDFKLSFISDNLGHITIKIELIDDSEPEPWKINAELKTEIGQLEQISNQIKNFFP